MSNLTARESEILTLSWECFKTDPTVNYTQLAELASLKNAASATTAFLSAKKKMLAKGTANLTTREREILALAWKCFHTAPSVDYKQLATKAELKNAASATTAFLSAKKKMLAAADGPAISEATAKKPKKTLPSARNRDAAAEGEETVVEPASPPKKKRKRANAATEMSPKSAAILAAVEGDGEGEEEVKPKRGRKGKGKKARSELEGGEDEGEGMVKSELEHEGGSEGDAGNVDSGLLASAQEFLKEEGEGEAAADGA